MNTSDGPVKHAPRRRSNRKVNVLLVLAAVLLFSFPFAAKVYKEYHDGHLFGGIEYTIASKKDLDCVQSELAKDSSPKSQVAWQRQFSCYTDLGLDSVIERAADVYRSESGDDSLFGRIGFRNGWKSVHQIPRRASEFLE